MVADDGSVERTLGEILGSLKAISDRLDRADESRAGVHKRLDDLTVRLIKVETGLQQSTDQLSTMRKVTDDVVKLRDKAIGAGTMGQWLLRVGIGLIGFAGWLYGVYTWLSDALIGRPPP